MIRAAVFASVIAAAAPALAEPGVCHAVDVELQPEARTDLRTGNTHAPQIVVWIEDTAGHFIDTVFITQTTGMFGLGNRPGRFDFNSAPGWPYGRRITTFPVWAERKPERFDSIMFNNGDENNLSHPADQSSHELHFCQPLQSTDANYDAMTCASPGMRGADTDKGKRVPAMQSKYPPRQDMAHDPHDHPSVETYRDMNPYDAISAATPAIGLLARIGWTPPFDLAIGDFVLWVEVSTEFDHNATYSPAVYPSPMVPWADFGEPYRGQPSVVYRVPFTIDLDERVTTTASYAGYGDPDGNDGDVRPPDATISTGVVGSGEGRLALVPDAAGGFRVRVTARHEIDYVPPNDPGALAIAAISARTATVSFVAPGDDAVVGTVRGYEVRYRIASEVTADNFDAPDSIVVPASIVPVAAGGVQELELSGLLPETSYSVGIRAYDDCHNKGAMATLAFTTPERTVGEVDACFIATAAYGSALAADVQMLRGVRDSLLRKTVLGELAVQAYYTFGPPVAGVIGESELLRSTARAALAPIVSFARRSSSR